MKPMLAAKFKPDTAGKIVFPCYCSPKVDGFRAVVGDGTSAPLLTRKLKPIVNIATQERFGQLALYGLDGELMAGDPTDKRAFTNTSSGLTTVGGDPKATFWVYDLWDKPSHSYKMRLDYLRRKVKSLKSRYVKVLPQELVHNLDELYRLEAKWLDLGFEGICGRKEWGGYKYGRATPVGQELWALKRFVDGECHIVNCHPRMKNTNEATRDATGAMKRSSHKAGKVAQQTLGTMDVIDTVTGVAFNLGRGVMTDDEAKAMWDMWLRDPLSVQALLVKYRHFPVGAVARPRNPVYHGIRSPDDV